MIGIVSDIFTSEPRGVQKDGKGQFSSGRRLGGHHKQKLEKNENFCPGQPCQVLTNVPSCPPFILYFEFTLSSAR